MPNRSVTIPVTFEKGLDTNTTLVQQGSTDLLKNWVPQPNGSLQARTGWQLSVATGSPPNTGRSGFWTPDVPAGWYVFDQSDGVYKLSSSGAVPSSGTWSEIDTISIATGHVPFTVGNGFLVYGNKDFTSDRLRKYNGTSSSDCGTFAVAGNALSFHKERFWSGGTDANPSRLYFSNIGDPDVWDLTNQYIEIGRGPTITAMAPFLDGLLIGTMGEVWFLVGDGPDSFAIVKLDGGSASLGNSIIATPVGAIICGPEVWLWTGGGSLKPIGKPIKTAYYEGSWQTAAWYEDRLYVCARDPNGGSLPGGNLWSWDPDLKAWASEDTGDGNESVTAIFTAGTRRTLAGLANNPSINKNILYRSAIDSSGAFARDAAIGERFQARTESVILGSAVSPGTLKHVDLLFKQTNGNSADLGMVVRPLIDDVLQTSKVVSPRATGGIYRERIDFGYTGYRIQVYFDHNLTTSDDAIFDLLKIDFECEEEKPR